jgi:hypothetical protein
VVRRWQLLLIVTLLFGCDTASPPTASVAQATAPPTAATLGVGPPPIETRLPSVTPIPTVCPRPTPSLVPALVFQNGNLDLNVPYWLGFVQFNLVPCREIDTIRERYGLGAAARVINEPSNPNSDPDDVRGRYYRASVPLGAEGAFVTRLVAHPEDFQYVEFAFLSLACISNCVVASSVAPKEGPAGTSFNMRICCFDAGTQVTKTFTLPSGRTIVIPDTAGSDRTVPAGWGGSAEDERGLYSLTVTGGQIGSTVRFRIR